MSISSGHKHWFIISACLISRNLGNSDHPWAVFGHEASAPRFTTSTLVPFHIITPIYGWTLNITLSWKIKVIYSRPTLSITPKWVVKSPRSCKIMVHTVENCPLSHLFEVCWPLKRKWHILELFLVVGKQSRKLCIRRLQPATTMSDRASLDFYYYHHYWCYFF